jgi:hypothetical protein
MKPHRTTLLSLLALLALLTAGPAWAQAVITGRVLDDISDAPVGEATVQALSGETVAAQARTDASGAFRMALPPGTYTLRAQRLGYESNTTAPLTVAAGASPAVDIRVAASELVLDSLQATARAEPRSPRLERNGFYERQQGGLGRFVTAAEIARQRPIEVSDVLRTIPGVRLLPAGFNKWAVVMSRSGGNCQPVVYMDNMQVAANEIDDVLQPEHVSGIEVYRGGSEVPAQWGGSRASCGAIVIWTKVGNEP